MVAHANPKTGFLAPAPVSGYQYDSGSTSSQQVRSAGLDEPRLPRRSSLASRVTVGDPRCRERNLSIMVETAGLFTGSFTENMFASSFAKRLFQHGVFFGASTRWLGRVSCGPEHGASPLTSTRDFDFRMATYQPMA